MENENKYFIAVKGIHTIYEIGFLLEKTIVPIFFFFLCLQIKNLLKISKTLILLPDIILFLTMEAKCEEIVALFHRFNKKTKKHGISLITIYSLITITNTIYSQKQFKRTKTWQKFNQDWEGSLQLSHPG